MIWRLASRLGPARDERATLSVLFFHRVFARPDPLMTGEASAAWFDRMLGWLQSQFTLLPLAEAVARLDEGRLPAGAAAISFDDGYRDNHDIAAPLLLRRGVPATFFVASGFLDGGLMWNDGVTEAVRHCESAHLSIPELGLDAAPLDSWGARSAAAAQLLRRLKYLPLAERDAAVERVERACGTRRPVDLMMTREQVRALSRQGFEIGGHTVHHPILSRLADADAEREIVQGREQLQAIVDTPVRLFAYPNGRFGDDYAERHRAMVQRAGFSAAFSTDPGVCRRGSDRWALPRFTPWDRGEYRFRLRLIQNQWHRSPPQAALPA